MSTPAPSEESPRRQAAKFELCLGGRDWLWVWAIVALVLGLVPPVWQRIERFETGADYRIPYALSKDYWLYERRMEDVAREDTVLVVGDSVVWGEYVAPDGTLSHFLGTETGQGKRFINAGVNGLFPLALEGLIRDYGKAIRRRKVLLHCNVLWMSSPEADLQTRKEQRFNHRRLVPQFSPWIPCYRADINTRLGIVVERHLEFLQWVRHLQSAYFDHKSFQAWTLADDGREPPGYPNSYRNPLAQVTLEVPGPPVSDPERGPASPRHKPWSDGGTGSTRFEWVPLESSCQWSAFERLVNLLRKRGNDVFVVIGPFNTHIMAADNRPQFNALVEGMEGWLTRTKVPHLQPEILPSELYGDASHPLTTGYRLLAERMAGDAVFVEWLGAAIDVGK